MMMTGAFDELGTVTSYNLSRGVVCTIYEITIAVNLKTGVLVNINRANEWTADICRVVDVGPQIKSWLLGEGSLTERLSRLNGKPIDVQVILQEPGSPNDSECDLLGLARGSTALIREVILSGGGAPWVFARTVVPDHSIGGSFAFVSSLGNQPLGHWLFANPDVRRLGMEFMGSNDFDGHNRRYGRRSRFEYRGQHILVAEYFLPSLVKAINTNDDC